MTTPSLDPAGLVNEPRLRTVRARSGLAALDLRELLESRELVRAFVSRDLKVRYKQTVLGAAWAVLQPVANTLVFSVIFGRLAHVPSGEVPYPLLALAGFVPWSYFSQSVTAASSSVADQRAMITKVYFPRVVLPLSPVLSGLLDLGVATAVLLGVAMFSGREPSVALLTVPLTFTALALTALATGLWLSALNALYRDFKFVVPFLVQLWLLASPVAYPSSLIPPAWRTVYFLNPLASWIECVRAAVVGTPPPPLECIAASSLVLLVAFFGGLIFFRQTEKTFMDSI